MGYFKTFQVYSSSPLIKLLYTKCTNFKTFQVYSSYMEETYNKITEKDFKTFQVYSSCALASSQV